MASRTFTTMNQAFPTISTRFSSGGGAPSIPLPSRGGGPAANLNLGSFGEDIAGGLANIGLDWLRSRLIPSSGPTSQPATPIVPSTKCPDGQIGFPPACFDLQPGGNTQGGGMVVFQGEAVMGRYGAALQPNVATKQIRRCPRGAVLGNDGLCYNRRDLNKSDRMWIPPRKPLLTGGELNAIATAARAAGKMKTQQKRLQKLGLLPKPNRGGRRQAAPGRFPAPSTHVVNVE